MRFGLVLCCLVFTTLAGCTDGGEGAVLEGEHKAGEGLLEGHGAIEGRVVNEQGLALKGARASLLGTNFFAGTNATGHFGFTDVPEGVHTLNVVVSGFQRATKDLEVLAGNVTDIVIQMVPEQVGGAGYRPHVHDYWGGQDTYALLDTTIDMSRYLPHDTLRQFPTAGITRTFLGHGEGIPIPLRETPDGGPPVILPGTATIDVTFTSDDPAFKQMWGLTYRHPESDGFVDLEPKTLGETWTIEVPPEAADSGHQTFSFWQFRIMYPTAVTDGPDWEPATSQGSIDVQMTLHRGAEILPEPGHRVFWEDGNSVMVRDGSEKDARSKGCCSWTWFWYDMDDGQIVPPGTDRLLIEFKAVPGGPTSWVAPDGFRLVFRPADVSPHEIDTSRFVRPEPSTVDDAGLEMTYELVLEPGQQDAFYQTDSNWRMYVVTPSTNSEGQTYWYGAWDFYLGVTAVKDE